MNIYTLYLIHRRLSKWRKTLQNQQQVLIIEPERTYRAEIVSIFDDQAKVIGIDRVIAEVDLICVFPVR